MSKIYGLITKKEKQRFPIIAGKKYSKLKKVGYKVIEFTYDVNPDVKSDKMLINEREIKRVIY
jgi:hypothetical protein